VALPAERLREVIVERSTAKAAVARREKRIAGLRCLIIVPAYNEGHSIGRLIARLGQALPEMDVLVVDDGSTDHTARAARAAREGDGKSQTLSLPFNLGIGGAMQTGYRYAALHGYDVAIQVDGDGQHRPREVRKLVEYLAQGRADFVVGSRFMEQAGYRQKPLRAVGARMLRFMLRLFSGQDMTDCTSGFRAANRRVIQAFSHWYPEDYPEPEVILLLHRAGYRIREVAVSMRQRRAGSSSISSFIGIFYVMKVSLCLILDMARRPWDNTKVNGPERGQG
jgi:glycosyltransferase involved in cell wall biosynthesis